MITYLLPRAGRVKLLAFFDRCFQLLFYFSLRFPENIFRDDLSVLVIPGGISALPASVLPFADAAFAVGFVFQGKMTRHSAERPAVWRVGGFQTHPELNTVAVRVFRNAARRPTVAAAGRLFG